MNDELSAQITSPRWTLPAYAQGAVWVTTEHDAVRVEGAKGLFRLSVPTPHVTVRFGGADGAALARLRWQADALAWDGSVRLGGYVDALHVRPVGDLLLAVLLMGAQPLLPDVQPYPAAARRNHAPYDVPAFHDALADDVPERVVTWLAENDDPLVTLAQDALINRLRVHAFGRLADESGGWHHVAALPLLLEGLTLFAP